MSEESFRELGGDVFFQLPGVRPEDDEVESAPAEQPGAPASIEQTVRRMRRGTRALQQQNRRLTESYVNSPTLDNEEPSEQERERRRRRIAREINIGGTAGPEPTRGRSENLTAAQRALMLSQGASFGFGDELAAAAQAPFSDRSYRDIWEDYQTEINQARETSPTESTLLEIGGGALGGLASGARSALGGVGRTVASGLDDVGASLAREMGRRTVQEAAEEGAEQAARSGGRRLLGAMGRSAAEGAGASALYGAGASQETGAAGIARDAAISGALGGALGAALPLGLSAGAATLRGARRAPGVLGEVISPPPGSSRLGALVPREARRWWNVRQARGAAPDAGDAAAQIRQMTAAADEPVNMGELGGQWGDNIAGGGPYRTPSRPMTGREARATALEEVYTPSRVDDLAVEMSEDLNDVFRASDAMREQGAITLKPARVRNLIRQSPPDDVRLTAERSVELLQQVDDSLRGLREVRGSETGPANAAINRALNAVDRTVRRLSGLEVRSQAPARGRRRRNEAIDWENVFEATDRRIAQQAGGDDFLPEVFNALDQLKRELGRGAARFSRTDRGLHEVLAGNRNANRANTGQEQVRRFLESADAWGPSMAEAQRTVNAAYADAIAAGRPFRRLFAQRDSGQRGGQFASSYDNATRADAASVARFIRGMGRVEELGRAGHLRRGTNTMQTLNRRLGDFHDVSPEVRELIDRAERASSRIERTIDDVQRRRRPALALEDIMAAGRLASQEQGPTSAIRGGAAGAAVDAVQSATQGDAARSIQVLRHLDNLPPSPEIWGPYAERAAAAQRQGLQAMAALVSEMPRRFLQPVQRAANQAAQAEAGEVEVSLPGEWFSEEFLEAERELTGGGGGGDFSETRDADEGLSDEFLRAEQELLGLDPRENEER